MIIQNYEYKMIGVAQIVAPEPPDLGNVTKTSVGKGDQNEFP